MGAAGEIVKPGGAKLCSVILSLSDKDKRRISMHKIEHDSSDEIVRAANARSPQDDESR